MPPDYAETSFGDHGPSAASAWAVVVGDHALQGRHEPRAGFAPCAHWVFLGLHAPRWRHYDPTVTPLGKILVAKSYNTRGNIEKTTKTDAVKRIPVHPVLPAMLAQWRLGGWPEMMGVRRGRMI